MIMKLTGLVVLLACLALPGLQDEGKEPKKVEAEAITSRVVRTEAGETVLIEEVLVEAPVAKVWQAYTTDRGYASWAAPLAAVDLRLGGSIRAQYDPKAKIGDAGTIVLKIVNYVPERLLTLQAEPQPNWPEQMKKDADHLMNVVVFESLSDTRTRVYSYGLGYRDGKAYESMLDFFRKANAGLYAKLKVAVERKAGGEAR